MLEDTDFSRWPTGNRKSATVWLCIYITKTVMNKYIHTHRYAYMYIYIWGEREGGGRTDDYVFFNWWEMEKWGRCSEGYASLLKRDRWRKFVGYWISLGLCTALCIFTIKRFNECSQNLFLSSLLFYLQYSLTMWCKHNYMLPFHTVEWHIDASMFR